MKMYNADLHIHTCLSPCAELDMSPKYIVREAHKKEIHLVGICDHNSGENVPAVKARAKNMGGEVNVIGGMEITSNEEVHILAFFDNEKNLFAMQKTVYGNLHGLNNEKRFGEQMLVNENDEVLGFNKKLLIGTTELFIEDIVNLIHELDGLAVAAHIDREGYSIVHQLGFIPQTIRLDAVEVSAADKKEDFKDMDLPVITSSDAHAVNQIGRSLTRFYMEAPNLEEIGKSLRGEEGRRVVV
ncbi:MAG: PHP domain-containing protein [bacterium]|nr:PHP domain-containing protein [bacterium]